jgi:hypothetical protein
VSTGRYQLPNNGNDGWEDVKPQAQPLKAKVAEDSGWEDVPAQAVPPRLAQKVAPVPSNFDREATEFGLGVASGASGLPETMHPLKDAVKNAQGTPTPTDEIVGESIFPGYGAAKGIYRAGKELFSGPPNEDPEDAAMRRAHGAGSLVGQVVPAMAGEASEEGGTLASKVMRTEGGAGPVRPGLNRAARVAGAVGGYELAKYPGAIAGGYMGPTLLDMVSPRRTAPPLIESIKASSGSAPVSPAINAEGAVASGGGEHPVTRIPIRETPFTNPLTPEQVPGKPQLREIAGKGDSRAGQELQRRGETVLYTPEEGYPPARESTTFSSKGGGTRPPTAPAPVPPRAESSGTPGVERRAAPGEAGPRAKLINPEQRTVYYDLKAQLQDPNLSLRDRVIMERQVADMEGHPFEHEKLPDLKSMKTEKRMNLKDATAASSKRTAGRKQRFGSTGTPEE